MRVLLTGATGVIGCRLAAHLATKGDEVFALTRSRERASHVRGLERVQLIEGDPTYPGPWQEAVEGMDAVVHLACAGLEENVLDRAGCAELRERRLDSTFQVAMAIEEARRPPGIFVTISNRIAAAPGDDVEAPLAGLIRAWEEQAFAPGAAGVRVVVLRLGYMLDPGGESLSDVAGAKDAGHPVGWIHVHDVVGCLDAALRTNVEGVVETIAQESLPLTAMQEQVRAKPNRTRVGDEARALLEWPLPLESGRPIDKVGHAFRFARFQDALEDLSAARPVKSSPSVQGTTSVAPSTQERRIVVLPCEDLLLADGGLHHNATEAVARLHSAGLVVIPATSRGGKLPLMLAEQLGVCDPIISADGSVLLDPVHQEAIRTEALSSDRITGLAMAVRTSEAQVQIVVERGIHVSAEPDLVLADPLRALTSVDEPLEHAALFARPATRLLLHAPPRRLERALAVVRETWWREKIVAIYEHAPDVVAVTAPSADRGVALQRVESMMGIPRRSSIVVASTSRDAGLLEFSGVGFALPSLDARFAAAATSVLATTDPIDIAQAVIRAHLARTMRASTSRG